ncbi:MAG TPA: hypothetical protein VE871_13365, partial [Longimicrobium sp.]|nr:hypothetical protein [Longimicrobium sp.]
AVVLLGWQRWRRAEPVAATPPGALDTSPPEPRRVPGVRLVAAGRTVAGGNPFRLDRAPAPLGFARPGEGMMPPEPMPYVPPPPPRPQLAVTGIVGPPWQALLEGVPGREGAVVIKRGDVLGDLRVREVTRTTVTVSAPDTTWRLTVRKGWQ